MLTGFTCVPGGLGMGLVLAMAIGVLMCAAARRGEEAPYAGRFADATISVELKKGEESRYSGVVRKGPQEFPIVARATATGLAGTFESQGNQFEFAATLTDAGMRFVTGGQEYQLKREKVNPLSRGKTGVGEAEKADERHAGKDPLAYKIHKLPGGTIATFDGWRIAPVQGPANVAIYDTAPEGREKEFVLRTVLATPKAQELENLFTQGPELVLALLKQLSPDFERRGEQKKCKFGDDPGLIEEYQGQIQGRPVLVRAIYVRRDDVAIAVLGIGSEKGFKEFGRSMEIVAQSITFKEATLEAGLIGTWTCENYSQAGSDVGRDKLIVSQNRSITLLPDGTFTDSASTGSSGPGFVGTVEGATRGRVIKRGNALTLHYDNGDTWSATYELYSNGLKLDGKVYLKQ